MSRSPSRIKRNPRKISMEAAQALEQHWAFKKANTEVRQVGRGKSRLYLHGHAIAEMVGDEIYITDAGYPTATTKERLNALPGVRVHTRKGQLYLNGSPWSGDWTRVDPFGSWHESRPNPRKAKKAWYDGWPSAGWIDPKVMRGRSTWGAPIVVSYHRSEDMESVDLEIFPEGKGGKLSVVGERSSHYFGENYEDDEIDMRGLTKKQAIAAVREFFGNVG